VSWTSALAGAGYLAASIAAATAASLRIASQFSSDPLERGFLTTLFALAEVIFVTLVMLMLGIPGRLSVLVGLLVVAAAVLLLLPRRPSVTRQSEKTALPTSITAAAFAGFIALSTMMSLAGPTRDTDTRGYHTGILISWLHHISFWSLPLMPVRSSFQGGYPSNAETLGLSLTLPTHRDQLSLLVPLLFAVVAILAIGVLSRELGAPAWLGVLAGVAVFAAPTIYWTQTRSLHSDSAAAAGFIAAVTLVVKAWKDERPVWLLAAGAGLGLAVGSRYALIIPCIAIILGSAILLRSIRRLLWLLPGLVVFAAPWFVRNAVATGNPFYPQTIHLGGRTLFAGSNNPFLTVQWSIASRILRGDTTLTRIWVEGLLWWLGPAILIIGVGALVGWRPDATKALRIGSALVIAAFLAYMITPLTGAGASNTIFNLRYALPTLTIGAAVAVATRRTVVSFVIVGAALVYDGVRIVVGSRTSAFKGLDLSAGVAFATVLVVAAVIAAGRIDLRKAIERLRRSIRPALVAIVVLLWLVIASVVRWSDSRYQPTGLEALVGKVVGRSTGPVYVLGVRDLRSVYGKRLETRIITPALTDPRPNGALLDTLLLASNPRIVIVDELTSYGIPANYVPPSAWCRVGPAATDTVWIRRAMASRGQACT